MPDLAQPLTQPFLSRARPPVSARFIAESGGWLFNVGVLLFIAAVVLFGGLFFYQRSLERTRQEWTRQVQAQEAELRPELIAELLDLGASLRAARQLLSNHVFASNIFSLLQDMTRPKVQFTTFGFAHDARTISLSGVASSYQTVAEQISVLESHPQVERVNFGGLSLGERGLVNFKLTITHKPTLVKSRSQ